MLDSFVSESSLSKFAFIISRKLPSLLDFRLKNGFIKLKPRISVCNYQISSIFRRRLLTFRWIRRIPFAFKTFHSFEQDD